MRGAVLGSRQREEAETPSEGLKVSLACGQRKPAGFFGVDIVEMEGVDAVVDLLCFPWPLDDGIAAEVEISHFVEHIPHWRPGYTKDGFFHFFDEVHRICKPGAIVSIVHPYLMSGRAFQDPTHERFINEAVWLYLSASWRRSQRLSHYPTEVDFEPVRMQAVGLEREAIAADEEMQRRVRREWNVAADLEVELRRL